MNIHRREIKKNEFCDPRKIWTTGCSRYFEEDKDCPRTCYFVVKEDTRRLWNAYEKRKEVA